jgi:zinc resistance-associated protein
MIANFLCDLRRILMLKPVIAATALFALAGSTFVYAQGFGGYRSFGDGGPRFERWQRPSAADMAAFTDARIAALKAGLELTPDQVKNWPPFEEAVRDLAQLRIARMQARQAADQTTPATPVSPFDRLSQRADDMSKTSVALKKVADAGAPLYGSLNDDQKGRFVMLAHFLRPHPHMHGFNGNGGGGFGGHGWWQKDGSRFGQDDGNSTDQGSKL